MFTDTEYIKAAKILAQTDSKNENRNLDGGHIEWESKKDDFEACLKTWKTINKMQEIQQFDTDNAWKKLHQRLRDDGMISSGNQEKKIIPLKKIMSIAASIVLVVGIASLWMWFNQPDVAQLIVNNLDEPQKVELPDGSLVFLNKNAQISYNQFFNQNSRNVKLEGEAFFEVEHNPQKPFIVECNQTSVKVLGTSFSVNASSSSTEVIVKTGRVEFFNNIEKESNVVLMPGEKGIFKEGLLNKMKNENLNFISWKDHDLVFKAKPLPLVIEDINRAYHSQIEIGDTSINNLLITTTFNDISLDEIMKSISLAFNLKIEKQSESHYVLLK